LTGDYYYLDEEYQGASYCLAATNADNGIWSSNGFYAYVNPSNYTVTRNFAWAMQTVGRAAFIAPDNTPESSLYTSMLASNIEVLEGFMKITGTSLTPTSANTGCSSYNAGTANRWDWGRCTVAQNLAPALHNITSGECPISGDVAGYVDGTKASEFESLWQYWFVSVALSHLHELGLTQVHSVVTQTWQRLIEMVKDPTFNPYLIAYYEIGIKGGVQACNNSPYPSANPFFTSWSQVKAALPPGGQTINTFNHGVPGDPPNANFACADHGYSLLARAAGTYITNMNSGSLSGIDAWSWIKSNVPYFSTCGDRIIKYALAPR
jgi:hypothetical protein